MSNPSNIYTDANNDPELKSWFTSFGKYIRRVLQEPGFVMTDECDEQGRAFRRDGKGFFSERYRPHREQWVDAVESWFRACQFFHFHVFIGAFWTDKAFATYRRRRSAQRPIRRRRQAPHQAARSRQRRQAFLQARALARCSQRHFA